MGTSLPSHLTWFNRFSVSARRFNAALLLTRYSEATHHLSAGCFNAALLLTRYSEATPHLSAGRFNAALLLTR